MKILLNNFLLAIGIGIVIEATVSSDVKKEGRRRRLGGSLPPGPGTITIAATDGLGERQLDGSLSSSFSMKTIAQLREVREVPSTWMILSEVWRVEILMQHL